MMVAAESRAVPAVLGCNPYPPLNRDYPLASIETTLRSGFMPNFGAAARMASAT
jgi:hypothetical protein